MTDTPADGIAVVRVDMLTDLILDVDVDPGVMIGVDVDMLSDTEVIAMDTPENTLEFVVEIAYAGDVLTDVGLAVVMTPLELTLSSPWEDLMCFC